MALWFWAILWMKLDQVSFSKRFFINSQSKFYFTLRAAAYCLRQASSDWRLLAVDGVSAVLLSETTGQWQIIWIAHVAIYCTLLAPLDVFSDSKTANTIPNQPRAPLLYTLYGHDEFVCKNRMINACHFKNAKEVPPILYKIKLFYWYLIFFYISDIKVYLWLCDRSYVIFSVFFFSAALIVDVSISLVKTDIHWASKETYHFFSATLNKIYPIKINHKLFGHR